MSRKEELKKVYDDYLKKIKSLYDKHLGACVSGQLDGEPWSAEERKIKKEMLKKVEKINEKYSERK